MQTTAAIFYHVIWNFRPFVSLKSASGRFRFLVPSSGTTCLSTSHLRRHSRFSDNDSRPFCFPVPTKTLSYDSYVTITIHHYCLDSCDYCNNQHYISQVKMFMMMMMSTHMQNYRMQFFRMCRLHDEREVQLRGLIESLKRRRKINIQFPATCSRYCHQNEYSTDDKQQPTRRRDVHTSQADWLASATGSSSHRLIPHHSTTSQ